MKMRYKTLIIAILCLVCLLVIIFITMFLSGIRKDILEMKQEVFLYVTENMEELNNYVKSGAVPSSVKLGSWRAKSGVWNNGDMVQFEIGATGLVPSSTHYGFFYVKDDKPIGYQGAYGVFFESGDGLKAAFDNDDWEYVERICENWYWYEMHF